MESRVPTCMCSIFTVPPQTKTYVWFVVYEIYFLLKLPHFSKIMMSKAGLKRSHDKLDSLSDSDNAVLLWHALVRLSWSW